jgi:dTDP-4-amino-4,6-dideoxygalactose transaminase
LNVPFLDLKAQYEGLKPEMDAAIQSVIDRTAFAGGPFVAEFEEAFAGYCGCRHAVGVGSGTEALWFAMLAAGIGPGDEVITAVNTFIATAEAISFCGAKPVFVDVDERTHNLDPDALEAAITPAVRAIVPVHLFGQMADMTPVMAIAERHGLLVIEDASQAHGAEYNGARAGSLAAAGCFSFYPGKNLGAYGEAGAVVTNDDALAAKMRMLRDHGQERKYVHSLVGWNGRMDGIQGAVLKVKLRYLDEANAARRKNAERYATHLGDVPGVRLPVEAEYARHVYHVYAVRVAGRDAVMGRLRASGIGCGIHYPIPLHLQGAYRDAGRGEGTFPVAETCAREFLSLPMYPELTEEQIAHVAKVLRDSVDGAGA